MKPKMLILSIVGLILAATLVAANMVACEDSREAESVDTPSQTAESAAEEIRMAGLLDFLEKEDSKERKIFEGVTTLLSGATEVDYESERTIGESLALEGFHRYGLPVNNEALQKYVNLVGMAVARNSLRPSIPYRFVVVDSELLNAFSCPGGIIFVSSGLVKLMDNEAQLACVLAHEVGHVAHKHALQSIRRARFLQGVGKITAANMKGEKGQQFESMIGDLQTVLFDKGLDQRMEFEADQAGMETAYRTGYDPVGMIEVLKALKKVESQSEKKGSWFSTHPPLDQRIAKLEERLNQYPGWKDLAMVEKRFKKYEKNIK